MKATLYTPGETARELTPDEAKSLQIAPLSFVGGHLRGNRFAVASLFGTEDALQVKLIADSPTFAVFAAADPYDMDREENLPATSAAKDATGHHWSESLRGPILIVTVEPQ
ncbi:hypothetical protein [Hymenobacter metallicola]|uniref:Uncharacterized protein n=1 Tax=Hymenobacter metallicola TaxID=2563114 RepID=A0A4Z0QJ88_9BACT|nr:hypothetical protein [Hymenobacter metallicola]TGE29844.1 hypothetical protein E5K02_10395 [Hymenobacter metallicola]